MVVALGDDDRDRSQKQVPRILWSEEKNKMKCGDVENGNESKNPNEGVIIAAGRQQEAAVRMTTIRGNKKVVSQNIIGLVVVVIIMIHGAVEGWENDPCHIAVAEASVVLALTVLPLIRRDDILIVLLVIAEPDPTLILPVIQEEEEMKEVEEATVLPIKAGGIHLQIDGIIPDQDRGPTVTMAAIHCLKNIPDI